jgi:cell wall-associated NlpC family hydrolase
VLVPVVLAGALVASAHGVPARTVEPPAPPALLDQPAPIAEPGQLDQLTAQLGQADSRLDELTGHVEAAMERANQARADAEHSQRDASIAQLVATNDAQQARDAAARADTQQARIDRFAANAFRRGKAMSPFVAFTGAQTPRQALDRAEMLETVSATEGQTLQRLQQARQDQSGREAAARQALQTVGAKRDETARAWAAAQGAVRAAAAEQAAQQGRITELRAQRENVQRQLQAAQERAKAEAARRGAQESARQRAEQHALAARERDVAAKPRPRPVPAKAPAPQNSAVERVIQRAMSQVGVEYAWGGGDSSGPTGGVRDGGVADLHGDFNKVGFDCSGLMVYAFAAAGIDLDHYSGYQYSAGRQVPVSQAQRGDLLFWQSDGTTHHVALYLGGGKMLEAPYSGSAVRVVPVRYDGIAPFAVRLL